MTDLARLRPRRVAALTLALTALAMAAGAGPAAAQQTTVVRTIQDRDRDNRLEPGPGEPYVVRAELGAATPGRERRRQSRVYFGQLTDMHVVDEESPLRVEFLDRLGPPFTSAYRPHEGITPQVLNEMVGQIRNTTSPATRRRLELVMTTGDNTDNTQRNETRWMIDVMDGGTQVNPNSGVEGTCGTTPDGRLYDGVRGGNEYYEPDSSTTPGADSEDGPGYSPDEAENQREAQRSNAVRDFPGLFEGMNMSFRATGLRLPWYGIFGNHDALVQGNQPRNPALEAIATGCVKVIKLSPGTESLVRGLAGSGARPEELPGLDAVTAELIRAGADPQGFGGTAVVVPQDPQRKPLRKSEYIQEHFDTRGTPAGHGFTAENVATGQGNYAFSPKPGVRFVVLDSVAEAGGPNGNIDEGQFQWIHRQLVAAEAAREVVFAFAHHSLRTMDMPPASPFSAGDQGGDYNPQVHYGERAPGEPTPRPCVVTDPATPPTPDETLRCLFLRHRSVVGFVTGHEHLNRVAANERRPGTGPAEGGFWELTTAAHIDWPQQSRTLDLVDNADGSLSIFATMIEHGAPPNPGGAPPPGSGQGAAGRSPQRLASISRELSYNDPDADNGEDGRSDARGGRDDRNVELLVRNPYAGG